MNVDQNADPVKPDLEIFERLESEVRGYVRSFPVVFRQARGALLTDEQGRDYIDFFSGAGTLNYGHNNPHFKRRLLDYLAEDGVVHGLDMATSAKKQFLDTFERRVLKPRNMDYRLQFTGPTGTNAVEAALKIARQVTGRQNVVSFTHGFHGVSGGSLAVTANAKFRRAAGVALANTSFVPYDGYFGAGVDTTKWLARMLEDDSSGMDMPAAVIVETVQGEGGVNVASFAWLRKLEKLCRSHDILLIVDDIQAGCGRTGEFFSFEAAGISPDIITLSKSLSGYGLPMSLVLLRPELDIWQPGAHSGTFRGNNMAFVTATAALDAYWADDAFAQQTLHKGRRVEERLRTLARRHPHAGLTVRGRGLLQGLVCEDRPELAGLFAARAFAHGLVIETSGARDEVLKLLPSLTMDEELLDLGLAIIERSVAEVLHEQGVNSRILKLKGA
ncbi:MAG: diaminobutyrate--2-oxoglutarate transaminase [Castellaniella sp.]